MIPLLEELAFNALPALQTVYYDGWLLRLADGYTWRANSVNPIYSSSYDLEEKIAYCEAVYAARGQDAIFRFTPAVLPEHLEAVLERRAYRKEGLTSVQTLCMEQRPASESWPATVMLWDRPTEAWLAAYGTLNHASERRLATLARMLDDIVPATAYVALQYEQETVAVGLAVYERGFMGLFDIVTAAHRRQQGFGTHLIHTLLAWGYARGARHAYLQVVLENAPAQALYRKIGFAEAYRYWYRVRLR